MLLIVLVFGMRTRRSPPANLRIVYAIDETTIITTHVNISIHTTMFRFGERKWSDALRVGRIVLTSVDVGIAVDAEGLH